VHCKRYLIIPSRLFFLLGSVVILVDDFVVFTLVSTAKPNQVVLKGLQTVES